MNIKKKQLLTTLLVIVLTVGNIYSFNKNMKYESYISDTVRINMTGVGNTLNKIENEIELVLNSDKEMTDKNFNYMAQQFLNIQKNLKVLETIQVSLDIDTGNHPGSAEKLFADLYYIFYTKAERKLDKPYITEVHSLIKTYSNLFNDVPLKSDGNPYSYYDTYWNKMVVKDEWISILKDINELAYKNKEVVR